MLGTKTSLYEPDGLTELAEEISLKVPTRFQAGSEQMEEASILLLL